jgi:hypothetical protein
MKKPSFEKDVAIVMESIRNDMGKEYRIDKNVTVAKAVHEIYENLDISLALCEDSVHVDERLKVVGEAMNRLRVYDEDVGTKKVSEFLPSQYMVHSALRNS